MRNFHVVSTDFLSQSRCTCVSVIFAVLQPISWDSLALWYTKQEIGLRMASWFGFAAVAGYVRSSCCDVNFTSKPICAARSAV